MTLGEVLDGDVMVESMYKLRFKEDLDVTDLCSLNINKEELLQFHEAIENQYYFEFVVDDLQLRNFVGYLQEGQLFPHTHKISIWTQYHFVFEYNKNHIISANVSVSDVLDLTNIQDYQLPLRVPQKYSVKWVATDVKYQDRNDHIKTGNFFPLTLEIHWLSVINSTIFCFLSVSFVILILTRIVKKDLARYGAESSGIHVTICLNSWSHLNSIELN